MIGTTRAQQLKEGDPLTAQMLDVLHWAERYRKSGVPLPPSSMDRDCLFDKVDEYLREVGVVEPGDIAFLQGRPERPVTVLKVDEEGDSPGVEYITPTGARLISSANLLTPTGYKAYCVNENIDYVFSHSLDAIVSTGISANELDRHGFEPARIVDGHVQIKVGEYWVAPFFEVDD